MPLYSFTYKKWKHALPNLFFTFTTIIVNFVLAFLLIKASDWVVKNDFGIINWLPEMLLWMYVLSFLKLSRAYPLLSFAYVLVYLGAVFWPKIGESFSLEKSIGVLIIIIGVIIVSIPSKKQPQK